MIDSGLRVAALVVVSLVAGLAACTTAPPVAPSWETRLRGDAIVLLGEVHDNAEQHRLRLAALRRAFVAGWRPALVMEQFDRGQQAAIEQARRERPGDARHVIDAAVAPGNPGGWDWTFYRPFVALALEFGVPLIAANLSNADTSKIARGGLATVFDAASLAALGLDRPLPADWQAAQEREIDAGHCGLLPRAVWPRMAAAQFARDAVMARALVDHAGAGAVLLAGNGHARRDLGVPRWLGGDADRVVSIGYLEAGDAATPPAAFDAVVRTAAAARPDPCLVFRPGQSRPGDVPDRSSPAGTVPIQLRSISSYSS